MITGMPARSLHAQPAAPAVGEAGRIFLGIRVPPVAAKALQTSLKKYSDVIKHRVPQENWHVTLAFIGEVENFRNAIERLPNSIGVEFVPTVTLTHIGLGRKKGHLWAYAHNTIALTTLRDTVFEKLETAQLTSDKQAKEFVPHITLAHTNSKPTFPIGDVAISLTFQVREVQVMRTIPHKEGVRYETEKSVVLTP